KEFKHITLLHTAGIFDILVNFCFCNGHPENFAQLLDLRMFPGSMERIGIAFTFELLDDFHLHTLTSKKTAFDYYNALQWKTNPMLPQKVQDSKCHAGQSHGIDTYVPHQPTGHIAIYCPACPEPGFNINVKEIHQTPNEKKHKHTLYIAVDGCHSSQRL
ncbi:hypothetical protein Moror_6006, partial [Moniliophthora roreri MCA 2997]